MSGPCGLLRASSVPPRDRRELRELIRHRVSLVQQYTQVFDSTASTGCWGRLIARILAHLGLPLEPPRPAPPRTPSWLPGGRAAHRQARLAGARFSPLRSPPAAR